MDFREDVSLMMMDGAAYILVRHPISDFPRTLEKPNHDYWILYEGMYIDLMEIRP